ncbi:MAG: hypothetical protein H6624_07590 [Bdellovibrionaceae bacterium]|nr:hypothetical protein [Bdellovibrionales bacterium]MCB9084192.1 hypothetical protein [Pseudobdellovibrionaceae bacterium]
MPKMFRFVVILGSLMLLALSGCTPPDKPYETVHTRRNEVTPLSVAENPGIGYTYYLSGRLLQAQYILETALKKGEALLPSAEENRKCRRDRILNSANKGREVFYFKYQNCQVQDDRVEARVFGEERYETLSASRGADGQQGEVLDHLSYTTEDLAVDLKPLKGVDLALEKKAEISERLSMVADLVTSGSFVDEQGATQWEDKYSFYFRTASGNEVFQDLILGDMSAKENMTETFQVFGFFTVRDGKVVSFSDGELRLNTSGSRKLRSKDRSVDFSKYGTTKIVLSTYADSPLAIAGTCSFPEGRLRRVVFEIPRISNPPEEDKKATRAYDFKGDSLIELRTGHQLGWTGCLAESWGRALPYGQMFLR